MIRKTGRLIIVSMMFYYMSILGLMVYVYQNPSIIDEIGLVGAFSNMNMTISTFLIIMLVLVSLMDSLLNTMKNTIKSISLYITYQAMCYLLTHYLIEKVARSQSKEDLFYFVMAPVILSIVFIGCIKFVSRILYGKNMYAEIKLLDKKASWWRFKDEGVSGFISTNIFADLSSVNGYIEASCSNIIFPDYYYKRFSLDKEGYEAAYNWITEKGKYMQMSRDFTVGENGNIKSSFPQTHEWNQENSKNEPCLFKIDVD
jgi:hypothetical protein